MRGNLSRFSISAIVIAAVLCLSPFAHAKVEWDIVKNIPLQDNPLDLTLSRDGANTYILCEKSIVIYSAQDQRITDVIPVEAGFTRIALSPDGQYIYLTDPGNKMVSVIQLSEVFDMKIGKSPVIGNPDAPVSIFAFFDFQ
ncbi:MAG: hypothetical protein GY859_21385 [Desulfobacterales bacterium]|nr:hypothetical protein [Desulfobacterales bacterium]